MADKVLTPKIVSVTNTTSAASLATAINAEVVTLQGTSGVQINTIVIQPPYVYATTAQTPVETWECFITYSQYV